MPRDTTPNKVGLGFITDLHGNTYKLGDYTICLEFPKFIGIKSSAYTKDIISGRIFNLLIGETQTYAVFYSGEMHYYVLYNVTHISYNELEDIRKGYIHGNKYHS